MSPEELDRLLALGNEASPEERNRVYAHVYSELRVLAQIVTGKSASTTLQPTAVVHEAWLKLRKGDGAYENRRHFLAVAARAMRQIVSNHARDKRTQKRGGSSGRVTLTETVATTADGPLLDLIALDDALARLEVLDERQARIIELRFFCGLTNEETAEVLGISDTTVKAEWRGARSWLRRELA